VIAYWLHTDEEIGRSVSKFVPIVAGQ